MMITHANNNLRYSMAILLGTLGSAGTAVHAQIHTFSGDNFTMLSGPDAITGGSTDVSGTLDTSKICTTTACTDFGLTLSSAQQFFGHTWTAHDIRVFAPGDYTFDSTCSTAQIRGGTANCGGGPADMLHMSVGPGQLGAHMLFDWNVQPSGANANIDVAIVWDINGAFTGNPLYTASGAAPWDGSTIWNLVSTDDDGDGVRGIPMVDGAFVGSSANFNLNPSPTFAFPSTELTATQGGIDTTLVAEAGGAVEVATDLAPGDYSFDWSASSPTLIAAITAGGTNSDTLTFDPSGMGIGSSHTATVTATNTTTNLPVTVSKTLGVIAGAAPGGDADGDGIPDSEDDGALSAQELQVDTADGAQGNLVSDAGTLRLGTIAATNGITTGVWGAGVTISDIGTADAGADSSCVGGCFDFRVSGLANGATVDVTLPLSAAIPANAVYRKFKGGSWGNFVVSGNDAIASAAAVAPGVCPAPGDAAYTSGLTEGDFCVQLTLTDGGPNDADSSENGTIVDPGGVAAPAAVGAGSDLVATDTSLGGGCSVASNRPFGFEWAVIAGFLAALQFTRRKRSK